MRVQLTNILLCIGLLMLTASAQQTGAVAGSTPGSAVGRKLQSVEVPRPELTCGSLAAAPLVRDLPELVFSRAGELTCIRHVDGSAEKVWGGSSWQQLSPAGDELAYWSPEKHELHVYSIALRSDTLLEQVPRGNIASLAWAGSGRVILYRLRDAFSPGLHSIDLATGKRETLQLGNLTPARDEKHLLLATEHGIERVERGSGAKELVASLQFPLEATESRSGHWLGILANNVESGSSSAASDDEPDCTGGTFSLYLKEEGGVALRKVPFPAGFDSVLDYAIAPDDRHAAVTFGAAACDYPGDVARVYLVSLTDMKMKPLSPQDHLSVKAAWSPDGRFVVYSDYSGSGHALFAVDIATGEAAQITAENPDGPAEVMGWYRGTK